MPIIDKYCSALSAPDVIHRIETLELDLGKIPLDRLEETLSESFERSLGQKLADAVASGKTPDDPEAWISELAPYPLSRRELKGDAPRSSAIGPPAPFNAAAGSRRTPLGLEDASPAPPSPLNGERAGVRGENDSLGANRRLAAQFELLAYYVNTGTLPWWAGLSRANLLEDNLKVLIEQAPLLLRRAMGEFCRQDKAVRRIALTYDDELLDLLFGVVAPALRATFPGFVPDLVALLASTSAATAWSRSRIRNLVWEETLRLASAGNVEEIDLADFCQGILRRLARRLGAAYRPMADDVQRTFLAGSSAAHPWVKNLAASLQQELTGLAKPIAESAALISPEEGPPIDLRFSDSDEVYVNNSGLVILWPFLENFFKHLGFIEEQRFKDGAARQRAAGLLQYVVSENMSPPEYLLPLNKVLCGLEVDEVFDFGPPVTELEIDECSNLLTAVIAQAPILHDISHSGFRASFLLRKGQLSARDGAWLLRVERETYDLVLDRFPWSIKWVKLPWMDAPLQVEW
jgi:hypothetical protein